ncbi:RNA polymerase sigma-70 factor of ECF subfamily [alpha proteobacterium U9-1i]|nr:RNA polymerase sigma-70 factor of ECF subfamily [alpha proteobacterium U9-1i]
MAEAASSHPDFRTELVRLMPNLRAFARSLCPNPARADDLVQDTLVKALANKDRFQPGTNMGAWLFTILRNTYYSDLRRTRREVEDAEGEHAASLADLPNQNGAADLQDFKRAFAQLNDDHREILTLVGAFGMPYEEAAEICGCAVGTVKSRVSRARKRLAEILEIDEADGADMDEASKLPHGVIAGSW